ncbi:BatA domain-containing protein [Marivirga sp.]|uniref:BatA domain-containing protein n=1 Tax=Marivirga sp. TaxID=2018662 RepID=UPI0025F9D3E1|nr:BatA domain-containing protein [Marivirga sp.]
MNFTNPNAFWLLFLIIIPILIHLFQFRRYKSLKFSNTYFLSAVNEEEKRSRKLKHILILITRILLITFLVFSMAKPFWESEAMQSQVNLVVLDKTPSNLNFAEGKSNPIVDENMSFINQLFEKYPQELKVVDQSNQAVEPYGDRNIQESKSIFNLAKILDENVKGEKILLLSDFQKPVIDDNLEIFQDSSKAYVFMPPYLQNPNNVMLDSVWIQQNKSAGENADLRIRLHAIGNVEEVNVALENNGQLIGTQQLEMDENATTVLEFPIKRFSNTNSRTFQITLEGDQLDFDNDFYFSVLNQDRLKVLSLSVGKKNELINTVFENEDLFEFQSESLNNFSFQDLDEFDLVLLHLGDELNNFASSALKTFAAGGNNLVIIPENNFDQFSFLEDVGFSNVSSINPTDQNAVRLEIPDLQNPFFNNIFSSIDGKLSMPESKLFMRWTSGQNLLSFANSYPFLTLSGREENIFAFSVPLNEDYTNFTRHGIFLPMLYKIAFSGKKENQVQYSYLDEEIINIAISDLSSGDIFKLRQAEQELVPDQRISGNQLRIILPQEDIKSGFYDVINSKTEAEVAKLALNFPKSESENSYYTRSELQDLFQNRNNIAILDGYDFSSIDDYIAETKRGFPLWKYFLVLALLSLLTEVLIIRFLK